MEFVDRLNSAIGTGVDATHLTSAQVCLRAVIVFFAALVIVRFADKRFFARKNAFDLILGFILASMMARAINGSEQLVPTLVAAFVLAALHRVLGMIACRWQQFGSLIKGHSATVIEGGRINFETLKQHHVGIDDLDEELRLNGVEAAEEVKLARLERSGEVSVIKKQ
jgi:uncharacterized membrane protein YcaP (DUF421 family)